MVVGRKMDEETLRKKCEEYKNLEGRASFYDVATEIVEDHPLHASIILLAVWNVGRFRFFASDTQNLEDLQNAINECNPLFEDIRKKTAGKSFKTVNFDEIEQTVKNIYSKLSRVEGVRYTGASKVMHLINKEIFVMWDRDTRHELGYGDSEVDYFNFLKDMQSKFRNVEWSNPNKTLAKAIDEYNQATITIPKKKKQLKEKKRKRGIEETYRQQN